MRLIDADALLQKRNQVKDFWHSPELYVIGQGYVMDAPTIDAVPVVRCENCKHYNRIGCSDGFGWCERMDRGTNDDFYCSLAERVKHG